MSTNAGEASVYPAKNARRDVYHFKCVVPIGTTGAVGTLDSDDPAWTVTRDATGTYSITYPKCPKATVRAYVSKSAALTVTCATVTAVSPTAGTATFKTSLGGATAADPASGDELVIEVRAETRG